MPDGASRRARWAGFGRSPRLRRVARRLDDSARVVAAAMRRRRSVAPRFVGVLDGRTLNVEIPVPSVAAADTVGAELRLLRGRDRRSVPGRVRVDPDGSCVLVATALLTGGPRGLDLTAGQPWLLEAVLQTSAGTVTFVVLGGRAAGGAGGPTVAVPPDPRTGHRFEPRTNRSGQLGITVVLPAPRAEVVAVRLDWLSAYVELCPIDGDGTVEFTSRTGEGRVRAAVARTDHGLRCDLPTRELAVLGGPKETIFDVYVRVSGRRLRVGRFRHDLVNPKPVLVPPRGIVWAAPGLSVNVRPYYTPSGGLALACRPIGPIPANGDS